MTERTTRKTVTFSKPFSLGADGEVFPPGHYVVETDEELLEPLSFTAYRRVVRKRDHVLASPGCPRCPTMADDPSQPNIPAPRSKNDFPISW